MMNSLKEWATVVKALEDGHQTIILRKGGILDIASGFKINSKKFFLFPTYEHQQEIHLKKNFHGYLKIIQKDKPENNINKITSYAQVLDEADIISQKKIDALTQFHIWSEQYIITRKNWMPEKPFKAIFLKIFKISPFEISIKPEYRGCKSWIDINAKILLGTPVLTDLETQTRLQKFREIIH